jgi:hypothetical protein
MEKERKQAERQEPQGFKSKTLIVENFFGLQGQEREKRTERTRKSSELVGAWVKFTAEQVNEPFNNWSLCLP